MSSVGSQNNPVRPGRMGSTCGVAPKSGLKSEFPHPYPSVYPWKSPNFLRTHLQTWRVGCVQTWRACRAGPPACHREPSPAHSAQRGPDVREKRGNVPEPSRPGCLRFRWSADRTFRQPRDKRGKARRGEEARAEFSQPVSRQKSSGRSPSFRTGKELKKVVNTVMVDFRNPLAVACVQRVYGARVYIITDRSPACQCSRFRPGAQNSTNTG